MECISDVYLADIGFDRGIACFRMCSRLLFIFLVNILCICRESAIFDDEKGLYAQAIERIHCKVLLRSIS